MMIASRPPRSISAVQASILARACAGASCSSAEVMDQRAAAAFAPLAARPRRRCRVSRRIAASLICGAQHLLRAAAEQRHAAAAAASRSDVRGLERRAAGSRSGSGAAWRRAAQPVGPQQRAQERAQRRRQRGARSARRKQPRDRAARMPSSARSSAVAERAPIGLLDMRRARDRRGACSCTPDGQVVMQERQDRQRSMCLTDLRRRPAGRSPACP